MLSIRIAQFVAGIMAKFGYVHQDVVAERVGEAAIAAYDEAFNSGYDSGYHYGYIAACDVADAKAHDEEQAAWDELLTRLDRM